MRPIELTVTLLGFLILVCVPCTWAGAANDASAYLGKVEQRIMAVWKLPVNSDGSKVVLRFHVARTGAVSLVRVEKTSGNRSFDESAVQAVLRANPFPSPPGSIPIGDVRMVLDPTRPLPLGTVPKKSRKTGFN